MEMEKKITVAFLRFASIDFKHDRILFSFAFSTFCLTFHNHFRHCCVVVIMCYKDGLDKSTRGMLTTLVP